MADMDTYYPPRPKELNRQEIQRERAKRMAEREERKRKEAELKRRAEEAEQERKAKRELRWMWGGFVVFGVAWFVYGLCYDVPVVIAVMLALIGGWGCVFIVFLTILLFQDIVNGNFSSGGGGGFSIPAPSKQTQRMLRRNIRRRWF